MSEKVDIVIIILEVFFNWFSDNEIQSDLYFRILYINSKQKLKDTYYKNFKEYNKLLIFLKSAQQLIVF